MRRAMASCGPSNRKDSGPIFVAVEKIAKLLCIVSNQWNFLLLMLSRENAIPKANFESEKFFERTGILLFMRENVV